MFTLPLIIYHESASNSTESGFTTKSPAFWCTQSKVVECYYRSKRYEIQGTVMHHSHPHLSEKNYLGIKMKDFQVQES